MRLPSLILIASLSRSEADLNAVAQVATCPAQVNAGSERMRIPTLLSRWRRRVLFPYLELIGVRRRHPKRRHQIQMRFPRIYGHRIEKKRTPAFTRPRVSWYSTS